MVSIRRLTEEVKAFAINEGADLVGIAPVDRFKNAPLIISPQGHLPEAKSVIVAAIHIPDGCVEFGAEPEPEMIGPYQLTWGMIFELDSIGFKIAKFLEAKGYQSIPIACTSYYRYSRLKGKGLILSPETELKEKKVIKASGLADISDRVSPIERTFRTNSSKGTLITPEYRERQSFGIIVTSAPLVSGKKESELKVSLHPKKLTKFFDKELKTFALQKGVDLFGIASPERIAQIINSLKKFYPQRYPVADYDYENKEWKAEYKEMKLKRPEDYLHNVKSIIVIGMHYPDTVVDRALEPPSRAVGPYAYVQEQVLKELSYLALDICRFLEEMGYQALPTNDLLGCASKTIREISDATANRYAAICAGLGELGWHGAVLTPEYGVRQRFVSIVTDAPLKPDNLYQGPPLCKRCFKCVESDPANSISKKEKIVLTIDGKTFEHAKVDRARRDWSHRYGLIAEEGPNQRGSNINITPPEKITLEKLVEAIKQLNPLLFPYYLLVVEKYLKTCPAHQGIGEKHK